MIPSTEDLSLCDNKSRFECQQISILKFGLIFRWCNFNWYEFECDFIKTLPSLCKRAKQEMKDISVIINKHGRGLPD